MSLLSLLDAARIVEQRESKGNHYLVYWSLVKRPIVKILSLTPPLMLETESSILFAQHQRLYLLLDGHLHYVQVNARKDKKHAKRSQTYR